MPGSREEVVGQMRVVGTYETYGNAIDNAILAARIPRLCGDEVLDLS